MASRGPNKGWNRVQFHSGMKQHESLSIGSTMSDWHEKPPPEVRAVCDAMLDSDRLKRELPRTVQVHASDWDKVILADEIDRLRRELEWSGKRWKAAMDERGYYENRCHELRRMIPGSGSEH